jgi:hypothetical protein
MILWTMAMQEVHRMIKAGSMLEQMKTIYDSLLSYDQGEDETYGIRQQLLEDCLILYVEAGTGIDRPDFHTQVGALISRYEAFMNPDINQEGHIIRERRGGVRVGAGRKPIGIKQTVTISLPEEDWSFIQEEISTGNSESKADYFRKLHSKYYREQQREE